MRIMMDKRTFKPEQLLILILPVLCSLLGLTQGSGNPLDAPRNGIGQSQIYLATGIVTAIIALFVYLRWIYPALMTVVIMPLIYSLLIVTLTPEKISLFMLYPPIFLFTLMIFLGLKYIFYLPALLRFRTILFSLYAGASLTLYFRIQYLFMKVPPEAGFWVNRFVNSLLLYIFIALGISIADMFITHREVKKLQAERREAILNDEIDEDDDDL